MWMKVLGIDLGTSNSLVGYYDGDKVCLIPNSFNETLTPSVVSFDQDNELLVGKIAKERLVSHPDETFSVFKRSMGTPKTYTHKGKNYTSTDLSSFILSRMKLDAECYLNESCEQAIISVPAYFNNTQRQATIDAAKIAGLEVIKLISEPTSAALAHGINEFVDDSVIIVLDLGGGTFDVSVLEMFDGILRVMAIAGDNMLGGEDFTYAIVHDFCQVNHLEFEQLSNQEMSIIYSYCEQIKYSLSNTNASQYNITVHGNVYSYELDQERFSRVCEQLLKRMRTPIVKALNDAGLKVPDIDQVILMGGATKMKVIQDYATSLFMTRPRIDVNPDETVAIGTVLACAMYEKQENFEEVMMTDVCGYTLGVNMIIDVGNGEYKGGYMSPIINRNTTLPCSRVKEYTNVHPYQTEMTFEVYQGEARLVKDNIKLGELKIKLPRQKDHMIAVRFTYDLSGILEVQTTNQTTNEVQKLVITNDHCSLSPEEIAEKLARLQKLKVPLDEMQTVKLMIARLDKLYELCDDVKKGLLNGEYTRIHDALNSQDEMQIKKIVKEVNKVADAIESDLNQVLFSLDISQYN